MVHTRTERQSERSTHTERVRRQLEHEIISGQHRPGAHLDETTLAARLGCSRTPVREALSQLVAIGLLTRRNHCGVTVVVRNRAQVVDLIEACMEIEVVCASLAVGRMSAADRSRMSAPGQSPQGLWVALMGASGNPMIAGMLEGLRAQLDPYRRLENGQGEQRDRAASADLAAAVADGDANRAANVIRWRYGLMIHDLTEQLPAGVGAAA